MPISLFSIIDEEKQWFKAKVGLDINETERDVSFCNQTIKSDKLLIIEDATKDERFCHNPVSYTHLDVYKRQGLKYRFLKMSFAPPNLSRCFVRFGFNSLFDDLWGSVGISYIVVFTTPFNDRRIL